MVAGIVGPVYVLGWEAAWQAAFADVFPAVLVLSGIGPGYVAVRGLVHLWLHWNRLRRQGGSASGGDGGETE